MVVLLFSAFSEVGSEISKEKAEQKRVKMCVIWQIKRS